MSGKKETLSKEELQLIGLNCYGLREKYNNPGKILTLRDFGKEIGLSFSAISEIENGKREMSMKELVAYQTHCKVSYDYLMGKSKVQSTNLETRDISNKTGLSENAIINLMNLNNIYELISSRINVKNAQTESNGLTDDDYDLTGLRYGKSQAHQLLQSLNYLLENISFPQPAEGLPIRSIGSGIGYDFMVILGCILFNDFIFLDSDGSVMEDGTFMMSKQTGFLPLITSSQLEKSLYLELNSILERMKKEIKEGKSDETT